jgi:hypothetical protein
VQMDIGEEGILLECLQKTENGEVQIAELWKIIRKFCPKHQLQKYNY